MRGWSVRRFARVIVPRLIWQEAGRTTQRRTGQIAVAFLVFIALILLLAASTMNLGEVARLKTSTANAADGGAIAGASWVASGENEAAQIAKAMWLNHLITQAVFLIPFCPEITVCPFPIPCCIKPLLMIASLWLMNSMLQHAANDAMQAAYEMGKAAALFTAIQNATIDDPTGAVQAKIRTLSQTKPADLPSTVHFDWVRKGANQFDEPSSLDIEVAFSTPQAPEMTMGGWSPVYSCWSGCAVFLPICKAEGCALCFWGQPGCCVCLCLFIHLPAPPWLIVICPGCIFPCWPGPGWLAWKETTYISSSDYLRSIGQGVSTTTELMKYPALGSCKTCLLIFPISLPFVETSPDTLENSEGDITVTVRQHREGGSDLRFWTMKYPDEIRSDSTAHYYEADVGLWPDPKAFAQLVGVQ